MSAAAPPAAAAGAAADFLGALDPLDWIVLGAAAVALVILVRELRAGDDDEPSWE